MKLFSGKIYQDFFRLSRPLWYLVEERGKNGWLGFYHQSWRRPELPFKASPQHRAGGGPGHRHHREDYSQDNRRPGPGGLYQPAAGGETQYLPGEPSPPPAPHPW